MLSIIMPVYNAEKYLSATVESVLHQSFRDFELILVDDGSTDGSGAICDSFNDPRIRVIHQKNAGVAAARNTGLRAAAGAYIGWVDSDDLIVPDMFRIMMETAEKYHADIVQCSHVRDPEKLASSIPAELPDLEILGPIDSLKRMYQSHYTNSLALWSKIFRRSLFDGLSFTEGTAFEDDELVPKLLEKSKESVFFELPLYCYMKRESSIVTAPSVKNILALSHHLDERMVWFRQLDEALFDLSRRNFYGYLKGKVWEKAFLGTAVQKDALARLKKHRKLFSPIAHPYDRIAMGLLYLPGGAAWVAKTEFEPIQSILRIFKR